MRRRWRILIVCLGSFLCAAGATGPDHHVELHMTRLREQMVSGQIAARGVSDTAVLRALCAVPRHRFVPAAHRPQAYEDHPLPIGEGQTISQPFIVGAMTAALGLSASERVLEVGTGSGYQAAVLAEITDDVYSIEIIPALGHRAESTLTALGYGHVAVRIGDGYRGWPEHAPFDAIIVTAAPDHVPQPLIDQLAVGGRLVVPVGDEDQSLIVLMRTEKGIEREERFGVSFVPMTGEAEKPRRKPDSLRDADTGQSR